MIDLIYLLNLLVDKNGKILIEELMETVAPVTQEEMRMYEVLGSFYYSIYVVKP
jgi:hypothetical protein